MPVTNTTSTSTTAAGNAESPLAKNASGNPGAPKDAAAAAVAGDVVRVLELLRARRPLVHCMTNEVVKDITANVLLAIGAAPAMIEQADEAAGFAACADALLVNTGTLADAQIHAMRHAIHAYNRAGKPWVLDPVAIGVPGLELRTRFSREILAHRPALIRGNASEIIALAGQAGKGRGTDSGDAAENALDAAARLVSQTGAAVLVTGPVDYALAGSRIVSCANGHQLLTRVTGVGCAQGALAAACAAVAGDMLHAAAAAAFIMAIAGELAAARAPRPGSFRVALLDEFDRIDADIVRRHARAQPGGKCQISNDE